MRHPPADGTLAIAVGRSLNQKIGLAATTYAAQGSCPLSCPFIDGGGCYAETGQLGKFVTGPLNEASAGADDISSYAIAVAEAEAIDDLDPPPGLPMRLHTVGDCSTEEAVLIVAEAVDRWIERGGGPVWTYTHAWRSVPRVAWGRVSVLASCESPDDVVLAQERGYAPSIVVDEFAPGGKLYTFAVQPAPRSDPELAPALNGDGVRGQRSGSGDAPVTSVPVLPCPAQTHAGVTCSSCRLCMDDIGLMERGYAIGFEVHGIPVTVRAAKLALRDPDDPSRRARLDDQAREIVTGHPTITTGALAVKLNCSPTYASQLRRWALGESRHPSILRTERKLNQHRPALRSIRDSGLNRRDSQRR